MITGVPSCAMHHSTAGRLDVSRSFAAEFVYQHLEAYLAELRLLEAGVRPLALFF